jgi:hypothetical protein
MVKVERLEKLIEQGKSVFQKTSYGIIERNFAGYRVDSVFGAVIGGRTTPARIGITKDGKEIEAVFEASLFETAEQAREAK